MKKLKTSRVSVLLVFIALVVTIANVIVSSHIQRGFDISIGDVSPRTFTATHAVENRVATEQLREDARATVVTTIIRDIDIEEEVQEQLNLLFANINLLRQEAREPEIIVPLVPFFYDPSASFVSDLPSQNMMVYDENEEEHPEWEYDYEYGYEYDYDSYEEDYHEAMYQALVQISPAFEGVSGYQLEFLIMSDQGTFNNFEATVFDIFSTLMANGITENTPGLGQEIYSMLAMGGIAYPLNHIGFFILDSYIQPNNIADEEETNRLREERASEVEAIVFLQNQNIVNEGEIITDEIYYALRDLGYLAEGYAISLIPFIGSSVIIAIMFAVACYYIHIFVPGFRKNKKHALLLFTLYIIILFATNVMVALPFVFVPLLLFTMLVGMLISYKLAIVLNICATIITFLIFDGDLSYILYFIITGTVVAIITRYALERSKVIIFSLLTSVVSAVVAISISLLLDRTLTMDSVFVLGYGALGGFFTVIIGMGTLPLWESFFGVITPIKLLDLTNPANPLLRRLSTEAPGTYHHSIIVANLSEAAAFDINADTILARVGSFFHDIGKLHNPMFFIENQTGTNPHDEIMPLGSADVIIDHVVYGSQLADEYRLPLVLRDIIQQHHGTTLLKFFYTKEKDLKGDEDVDPTPFLYPGPLPQSKEAAIVMLADTIEAAVRSMASKLKTKSEMAAFVNNLIKDKLLEGQLIDSSLTIRDLDTIERSFLRVLNGMYHERIPYPAPKK
ncbi:MAG: HDIG domain-containing protein [Defluviitaleaceae bacterium]|nr:HDIG domain-containing protein [Defluviitaleaceae bacterium]